MEISQTGLFLLIIYSAATGCVLGMVYSVIRLIREIIVPTDDRYMKTKLPIVKKTAYKRSGKGLSRIAKGTFVAVLDFLFMITCAVAVILVAYTENMGRMRWLVLFGTTIGFALYRVTLGKLILKISVWVGFLIRATTVYLYSILTFPIYFIIKKIKRRKRKNREDKIKKGRKKWHIRKKTDAAMVTALSE